MKSVARDGTQIEWSEVASVSVGDKVYNPFQRNSYSARVTYPDGAVVVVALPWNARRTPTDDWVPVVLHEAGYVKSDKPVALVIL